MRYNHSTILVFSASVIASCCATEKAITSFDQWDQDLNGSINQTEFISSYSASEFIRKWTGNDTMNHQELYHKLFQGIDSNHDYSISKKELHEGSRKTYLDTTDTVYTDYDKNLDKKIDQEEFINQLIATQITLMWDTNSDDKIDVRELAERMFMYCDLDSNEKLGELEFYLWEVNR